MSLVEEVGQVERERGWTCVSRVLEGYGPHGPLQWRCGNGHEWVGSLQSVRLNSSPK